MTRLCSGLCAAVEVDNTKPQAAVLELGDPTASAKQPTEATSQVGNATCAPGKRGSVTSGPETCRFLWIYNVDDAGMLAITDYTDTLGVCFARDRYKYDSDGDGALTAADLSTPACATLPPRSAATPGKYDDAADFFCQTVAHSMFSARAIKAGDRIDVREFGLNSARAVNDGGTPVLRHLFSEL
ncbi:MAG: hypothetical protein IPQ07_17985 [Myxococcales bacterium]|nr:hypothetical protein [Myxococcales bacterium]